MEGQNVSTKIATGIARILLHLAKPENRNETDRDILLGVAGDCSEGKAGSFLNLFIDDGIPHVTDAQIENAVKGDFSEIINNITPTLDHFGFPSPRLDQVQP